MPTVTETTVDGWASCRDGRCPGYKQEPIQVVETLTEFSYVDLGGDVPGIERSTMLIRFADPRDEACEHCGGSRIAADQVRPIYPNVSGQPQDALLHVNQQAERVRDIELADAKRDAEVAQMRSLMERQLNASERQQQEIARLTAELAARPRGPGRPRKTEPSDD